jgi:hypothetical protein
MQVISALSLSTLIGGTHKVLETGGLTASAPVDTILLVSDEARDNWCSFCGKRRHQVQAMAATGDARICQVPAAVRRMTSGERPESL